MMTGERLCCVTHLNSPVITKKTSGHVRERRSVDSGWKWVIALAGMINFTLSLGIYRSIGVLQVELMNVYDAPATQTSLLFSCFGVSFTASALFLTVAFDGIVHERALIVIGSTVMGFGCLLTFSIRRIEIATIATGLSLGVATQTYMSSSLSMVAKYFRTRLSVAVGVCQCGGSLGVLVWPILMRYLIDEYGYQGAYLIVGGLALNCVVCAAVMRPLPGTTLPKITTMRHKTPTIAEQAILMNINISDDTGYMSRNGVNKDNQDGSNTFTSNLHTSKYPDNLKTDRQRRQTNNMENSQKSSTWATFMHNLRRFVIIEHQKKDIENKLSFRRIFALQLFKNPIFVLLQVFNLFFTISIDCLVQFYPAALRDKNINEDQSAYLLSIIGLTGLAGRVFFGIVGDYIPSRYMVICASQFVLGIAVFLFQYAETFSSQVIYALTVGLMYGVYYIYKIPLLRDFFDPADGNISKMIGVDAFVNGVGFVTGGPLIGWLRDTSGGYQLPMYVAMIMFLCNTAMIIIVAYLRGLIVCGRKQSDSNDTSVLERMAVPEHNTASDSLPS